MAQSSPQFPTSVAYQNSDNPTNQNNATPQAMASNNPNANLSSSPAIPTNPTIPATPTPVTPPTSTIDASTLGTKQPIQSPAATPTTGGSQVDANGNVVVQGSNSFVNGLPAYAPPPDNPTLAGAEQTQSDLTQRLASLQGEEDSKGTATAAEYASTGVNADMQNMTALYNNLQTRTAQFDQQEENAFEGPGSGQSQNIALGAEGLVQRQAAVELGVDTAVYNAANNNYTTAKAIADQTIAFQFAPIEQKISDTQTLLQNNATSLSIGEQKQATIVQGSLALQSAQIDQAKTDRSTSMNIMTDAAQAGLTDPATLKAIANADPGTAASMAAPYLSFQYLQGLYLSGALKTPPTPPGTAPVNAPVASTPAVTNNNPGNLKDPKTGQFMQFPSSQAGFIALQQDLYAKGTGATTTGLGPNSTLAQFAATYAPASDGNDPTAYAKNVAATLGVSTSAKLSSLVSDPTMLQKFANAVSLEEDPTENQFVNGTQTTPATQSTQTQSALENANNIIQSAPIPFQGDLKTVDSTGDVFSTATPGSQSASWATIHNIPIITSVEATSIKGIDAAYSSLQSLQNNFSQLAPGSALDRFGSPTRNFFSTMFSTPTGEKINTYNDTSLVATANALGLVTDSNGKTVFSNASGALPKISGGSLLGSLSSTKSDTLSGGNDKINALLSTLNATYKSILPNSQGIPQIQTPSAGTGSINTMTNSQGQTLVLNPSDGLYYPSTQ